MGINMNEIKEFEEYQKEAHKTAIYPEERALEYLTIGLAGEVGIRQPVATALRRYDLYGYHPAHGAGHSIPR
jgi:hypothetical protein